jgi:hypothetical protein
MTMVSLLTASVPKSTEEAQHDDRGGQRAVAEVLGDLNERRFMKVSLSLPTRCVDRSKEPLAGPHRERSIE